MAKIIKNISNDSKTWGGVFILSGASYSCANQSEARAFLIDDSFISSLSGNDAEVYNDAVKITGISNCLQFLDDSVKDSDGATIVRTRAFVNTDGFRFRGASFTGTATAGQSTSIDFKLIDDRYCNGGRLLVSQTGQEDQITFQVVDKDNILGYGAGVVLDQFIDGYYIPASDTLEVKLDYPAKIIAGLYMRLIYKNTSLTDTIVKCNLFLHWKTA